MRIKSNLVHLIMEILHYQLQLRVITLKRLFEQIPERQEKILSFNINAILYPGLIHSLFGNRTVATTCFRRNILSKLQ